MSEICLSALRAGTPIGFLAALGAFRHAGQFTESLGDVRLRWSRKGSEWSAVLVTERDTDAETLLAHFVERACSTSSRPEFTWADQIKKNTTHKFREVVTLNRNYEDWFAAFGTELAVSKDGTLQSTDFDMTGGQQKFLLKLRDASKAISTSRKGADALLREALFGPWLYKPSKKAAEVENSHSMGLDPSTLLQGAFTAEEPASISDKRGVRGAIWFAFEALPLFPCCVSGSRLKTVGFVDQKEEGKKWKRFFEWGVWEEPMTLAAVRTLLLQSHEEWTRERGIAELFRSERVNLSKDYYSLATAELVSCPGHRISNDSSTGI